MVARAVGVFEPAGEGIGRGAQGGFVDAQGGEGAVAAAVDEQESAAALGFRLPFVQGHRCSVSCQRTRQC